MNMVLSHLPVLETRTIADAGTADSRRRPEQNVSNPER